MTWWMVAIGLIVGIPIGIGVRLWLARARLGTAEREAQRVAQEAQRKAETVLTEARLQAKADILKAREEFEGTTKARREELSALDNRIAQREANLDRKVALIDKKDRSLEQRADELDKEGQELGRQKAELQGLLDEQRRRLQALAAMTQDEARQALLKQTEGEVRGEVGGLVRRLQEEAKETAERQAQRIVTLAIQRFAANHAAEYMTNTVALPNDEMKGRIIGRDGRNIRALEALTGVNLLVDDTPEAVVVSSFDPVRREIARVALERLIQDGRIHPARIEEVVNKTREEIETTIGAAGEEAAYSLGLQGLDAELLKLVGRLKFRSSYSQNVLVHSVEVAQLMGLMAGELGLDTALARRVGLFHDIGKALDHDVEGGHAAIGADVLRRHGETPLVVNAVAAHHDEVPAESLYAVLAAAGDAVSAARPGARSETTGLYLKRLERLESVAGSFPGVEKTYAIQAGREVRVLVQPERIDDAGAMLLARNICKKIENELQYPGQIRVTVVRETRCVEYAR
jgi:ribonuclease Y